MPSLLSIGVASFVAALGVTLLIAAAIGSPPRFEVSRGAMAVVVIVFALSAVAAGVLLAAGLGLVALADAGVAMGAAAILVAVLRARRGDDGRWGGGGGDEPPPDPDPLGGDGAEWERFEAAFWEYVERQPVP